MSFRKLNDESFDLEDSLILPSPKRFRENIENISMPSVGLVDLTNEFNYTQSPSNLSNLQSRIIETSDPDNTLNSTDYLLKEIDEALSAKRLLDGNLESEINNYRRLLKDVARVRSRCSSSRFVVETMREVFEDSADVLPSDLREKCSRYMRFASFLRKSKNTELLEAINISDTLEPLLLTSDEKQTIHSTLTEALGNRIENKAADNAILQDSFEHFSKYVPMPGSTITEENAKIISLISEINTTISSCFEMASSIEDAIKKLCDFHVQKWDKMYEEEMVRLTSRTKLLELELQNMNSMIENSMVRENELIMPALDALLRHLQTIFDESEYSLQKTEAVKQSYGLLKGTKFDVVLHEYLELRERMKHKQWALKHAKI